MYIIIKKTAFNVYLK